MWRLNRRGGVLLDLVLVVAIVLLGSFALYHFFGLTLGEIVAGSSHFFGV